jgi:hypothetical protein
MYTVCSQKRDLFVRMGLVFKVLSQNIHNVKAAQIG